jgi:Lanthionine synthetase C-like protein
MKKNSHIKDIALPVIRDIIESIRQQWSMEYANLHIVNPEGLHNYNHLTNIESGIAGHILLLLEANTLSDNTDYIQFASELASKAIAIDAQNDSNDYSLYRGKFGLAYALIQLNEQQPDKKYTNYAQTTIDTYVKLYRYYNTDIDLYNGKAGILLVMLHILPYIETNGEFFDCIHAILTACIARMSFTSSGIYWITAKYQSAPLTDFFHGTQGLLFLFHRLYKQFPNPAFRHIATEAQRYMNARYNQEENGWMATAKKNDNKEDWLHWQQAFQNNKDDAFSDAVSPFISDGTAGIMLSKLLMQQPMNKLNQRVIDSIFNYPFQEQENLSINKGLAGILLTQLIAAGLYPSIRKEKHKKISANITTLTATYLYQKEQQTNEQNNGLLNGWAGLAYVFCHALRNKTDISLFPSISTELPDISPKTAYNAFQTPADEFILRSVAHIFDRSLELFDMDERVAIFRGYYHQYGYKLSLPRLKNAIVQYTAQFHPEKAACIKDVTTIEATLYHLKVNSKGNHFMQYIHDLCRMPKIEKLMNMADDSFSAKRLSFKPNVLLKKVKWDWTVKTVMKKDDPTLIESNAAREPGEVYALLAPNYSFTGTYYKDFYLDDISAMIIYLFRKASQRVDTVVDAIMGNISWDESIEADDINTARSNIIMSIRNFVWEGVLEEA